MSQAQIHRPTNYGDVFPSMAEHGSPLASEPVTFEDASLMQTAEALAFGKTIKGGAASALQSAAAHNVKDGLLEKDAHSKVAEEGLGVTETEIPGIAMEIEFVAGEPVAASVKPTPTDPTLASVDAVTIGEALEAAAIGAGDRPVEDSDARAIASAEHRATGVPTPEKGGIGATAQSAAQFNLHVPDAEKTTLSDILMDATADLSADKVVTYEDAYKVLRAELRGTTDHQLAPNGIAAILVAAAEQNEAAGLIPPPSEALAENVKQQQELEEGEQRREDEGVPYKPLQSEESVEKSEELSGLASEQEKSEEPSGLASEQEKSEEPSHLASAQPSDLLETDTATPPLESFDSSTKPLLETNNEKASDDTETLPAAEETTAETKKSL